LRVTPIDLPLLDHHCHGVVGADLSSGAFEALIGESPYPPAPGTSYFRTPLGLAIRRWCAPLLDLEPHASAEAYLERRRELGAGEANRRFLRAAGLGGLIVDTGYRPSELLDSTAVGALVGAPSYEVVRLEAVAERVARAGVEVAAYPTAFAEALERSAAGAVGLKTIVAYRGGFAFDPAPPTESEGVAAAGRWLRACEVGEPRLDDMVLIRHAIWTGADLARRRGLPLQVHAGYGDPDLTLHLANPSLLTELVKRLGELGVNVVFLHCYPYHREAGYLARVFPHVYLDLGAAITHTGPSAGRILAEALELAPFTKQLYSSDAFGLAELYYLGAALFRQALGRTLDAWVRDDACSATEADQIARLIASENARRIYPLPHRDGRGGTRSQGTA
jgi:uncharacterized protein